MALSIVGVFLIVQTIPELVGVATSESGGVSGAFGPFAFTGDFPVIDRGAAVATHVARIVLGVLLISGAGEISRSLARRYPEPEPPAPGREQPPSAPQP